MVNLSPFWTRSGTNNGSQYRIGFTDGDDVRVIEAAKQISQQKIASPVLISSQDKPLGSDDKKRLSQILFDKQKSDAFTTADADSQLNDPLYRGIALLLDGKLDGLVGGSTRPTADIVRAAIKLIGPRAGYKLVSGHFLIETTDLKTADDTPFLFADCAVVPEPSSRSLAAIASGAAAAYKFFTGKTPKVAFLSFSTRDSAAHPLVDRIKEAVAITRKQDPSLIVDGDIQADAALDAAVAGIKKAGDSPVAGKTNVFVFPTLEAGNIGYKLVQRFSQARVAGPILWGLGKPVSDLSRGCTVQEIVDTTKCVVAMIQGLN